MSGLEPRWAVAQAVVTGRGHTVSGQPCQDAVAVARRDGVVVACVCDGAGSAPLSQFGAQAVATAIVSYFERAGHRTISDGVDRDELIGRAREAVTKIIPCHGGSPSDYACTVVCVVVVDDYLVIVHLGDGLVLGYCESGYVVSCADNGDARNETYFITGDKAIERLRVSVTLLPDNLRSLAIMSDGSAELLYDRKTGAVSPVVEQMASWLDQSPEQEVSNGVRRAIEDHFVPRTADDCGLVILRRTNRVVVWRCPVCRRADLVREPLERRQFLVRCPLCGHSHLDGVPRGARFPYVARQWVRHLVYEKGRSLREVQRLSRVPLATLRRWLRVES